MNSEKFLNKNEVIIILTLITIVSSFFGISQYLENKKYEGYLSQKLTNEISIFSSLTGLNYLVLDRVINDGKINKQQYENMQHDFSQIIENGYDFVELASQWLKEVDAPNGVSHPYPIDQAIKFSNELNRGHNYTFKDNDELILSDEQLKQMELMRDTLKEWITIISDNMTGITMPKKENLMRNGLAFTMQAVTSKSYFDRYSKSMVESKDWVHMVQQLQEKSLKHEAEYQMLFY